MYDVLAMLQTLGISTWFLTLSTADLHRPEMIQAVAVQFGRKLSQNDVLKMSIADRSSDMHLFPRSTPIFLRSILDQVNLAVYLTLGSSCHSKETN